MQISEKNTSQLQEVWKEKERVLPDLELAEGALLGTSKGRAYPHRCPEALPHDMGRAHTLAQA